MKVILMNQRAEREARAAAGSESLKLIHRWGLLTGESIIRGYLAAFLMALCAIVGPNETRRYVDEVLPRPHPSPPKLVA
jgi:hypothetical protein